MDNADPESIAKAEAQAPKLEQNIQAVPQTTEQSNVQKPFAQTLFEPFGFQKDGKKKWKLMLDLNSVRFIYLRMR